MAESVRGLYWQVLALKQKGLSLRETIERLIKGTVLEERALHEHVLIAPSDLDT